MWSDVDFSATLTVNIDSITRILEVTTLFVCCFLLFSCVCFFYSFLGIILFFSSEEYQKFEIQIRITKLKRWTETMTMAMLMTMKMTTTTTTPAISKRFKTGTYQKFKYLNNFAISVSLIILNYNKLLL